jgi:hypothetical protein
MRRQEFIGFLGGVAVAFALRVVVSPLKRGHAGVL